MPSIFSNTSSTGGHKTVSTFNENSVYPVVEPERLLSSIHRMRVLQEIKEVAELPDEYFDALYRNLVESFTAFVQILPVNNEARLSSILDEGLLRALFALQVQRKSSKDEVEPLMSYVLFSACLLFDVACVVENRTIVVSEQGGSFIRIWQPIREGSLPIGGYYRIRRGGGLTPWSCRRSVVALASRLMPQAGYAWIFQSSHVFNIWIALLSEDKEGAGVLSLYIDRAREMLEEYKTSGAEYYVQTNIEEFEPTDTKEAELFLAWYLQELEKGKIQPLQVTDEKILITQDVIKQYVSGKKNVSATDVLEELEKLGVNSELEVFYSNLRHKVAQSTFTKQQGFGDSSSLFGAGREILGRGETKGEVIHKQSGENIVSAVSPEEQLKVSGRVEGYAALNVLLGLGGLSPAVFNTSINLVSATPERALANQLPPLDSDTGKSPNALQLQSSSDIKPAR